MCPANVRCPWLGMSLPELNLYGPERGWCTAVPFGVLVRLSCKSSILYSLPMMLPPESADEVSYVQTMEVDGQHSLSKSYQTKEQAGAAGPQTGDSRSSSHDIVAAAPAFFSVSIVVTLGYLAPLIVEHDACCAQIIPCTVFYHTLAVHGNLACACLRQGRDALCGRRRGVEHGSCNSSRQTTYRGATTYNKLADARSGLRE